MSFNSLPLQSNQFGAFNYLLNGNFDRLDAFAAQVTGCQSWNAYKNTAQSTPVTGAGGSPTVINNAIVSASTLRGIRSWTVTKTGNAQGEGYSTDFTIDAADKSRNLTIAFDFSAGSAYTAGDLAIFIYDITNASLITPSVSAIPGGAGYFQTSFASTTSSSYRLIVHCAVSNATTTNWSMELDGIRVSNLPLLQGNAIGDWQDSGASVITAVSGGLVKGTTNTFDHVFWRRIGDSMEVNFELSLGNAGSAGTGTYLLQIPGGYQIDTTKTYNSQTNGTLERSANLGCGIARVSASNYIVAAQVFDTTHVTLYADTAGSASLWSSTGFGPFSSTPIQISVTFIVPIVNWSSNVTLASSSTEFAFNTGTVTTAGGSDTTSFGYGQTGTTFNAFASTTTTNSQTSLRCRFQNPIQPSDVIILEFLNNGQWTPQAYSGLASTFNVQNTTYYGVNIQAVSGTTTDVDVQFANGGRLPGATYAAAGTSWSGIAGDATRKWRLRKQAGTSIYQSYDYEEGSLALNFNAGAGVSGSNLTTTIKYKRIGKLMTLNFIDKLDITIGTTTASLSTATGTIPSRLVPATDNQCFLPRVQAANVASTAPGMVIIGADGSIGFRRDAGANWTATATNNGYFAFSYTYTLA